MPPQSGGNVYLNASMQALRQAARQNITTDVIISTIAKYYDEYHGKHEHAEHQKTRTKNYG